MITDRVLSDAAYGTHLVPLIAAVKYTNGNVLELGMGDYSTPVLHEVLKNTGRMLISVENDREWFHNFKDLSYQFHALRNTDYKDPWLLSIQYSVIFVDNAPAPDRAKALLHFMNSTEIFVVHDTDKMKYYGYEEVFSQFEYRYTYPRYRKSTTLLSNTIDVTKIFKS